MLSVRAEAVRSRLTVVIEAATTVVNSSSVLALTPRMVVAGCNPDETKLCGVPVLDRKMLSRCIVYVSGFGDPAGALTSVIRVDFML